MTQDVNAIIDNLSADWANESANLRKRIAILLEENNRLKAELEELKQDKDDDNAE